MRSPLSIFTSLTAFTFVSSRVSNLIPKYDVELSLLSEAVNQGFLATNNLDVLSKYYTFDGGTVKEYRPKIFKNIRNKYGVKDQLLSVHLSPEKLICIANSDSKSGQRFWITKDGFFVIKTIKQYEAKNFQRFVYDFGQHVISSEQCTIAGVFGLYRVKLRGRLFGKYYLITRNVFPLLEGRDTYIHAKYDLKGSTQGRQAAGRSSVLKDGDLLRSGNRLALGPLRPAFLSRLEQDLLFLQRYRLMDYSLLAAVERAPTKQHMRFVPRPRSLLTYFGSSLKEDSGKLLLLGSDGNTYHFGIIDFLQVYTFRKRIETFLKSLFYGLKQISCVPPGLYARRLLRFIEDHSL